MYSKKKSDFISTVLIYIISDMTSKKCVLQIINVSLILFISDNMIIAI